MNCVTDVSSSPQTVSISELLSAGDMVLDWSSKEKKGVEEEEGKRKGITIISEI